MAEALQVNVWAGIAYQKSNIRKRNRSMMLDKHQNRPLINIYFGRLGRFNLLSHRDKCMTYIRNDEKFDAAMKSLEARRRKVEANGYAAGALVLANNNSSFLKWGRRAQLLGVTFFLLLPNLLVMKHGLGWF